MQNTRLNSLVNTTTGQLGRWFLNPWRRLSLLLISLLFGIFLGTAISTSVGQAATLDVIGAGVLVVFTEIVDRIYYSRIRSQRFLWLEALNALKIGLIYSLFLEAFKLGS